ncbi:MAG: hypothetical protein ABH823_05305 [bacterium]
MSDWTLQTTGTNANLNGAIIGSSNAFLIGDGGTIMVDLDGVNGAGGFTEVDLSALTIDTNLNALDAVAGGALFVVGDEGIILAIDQGVPVIRLASNTTKNLNAIAVNPGGNVAFAVGDNGTALMSTDLTTWIAMETGTTEDLYGIVLANTGSTTYAVGANGTVLAIGEGNSAWQSITTGFSETLYDVIVTSDGVFAVGENGQMIMGTID